MNQETRRSEGIGARVIPASRDRYLVTRRKDASSPPVALTRYSFGPSILTIVADKMPVGESSACSRACEVTNGLADLESLRRGIRLHG